MNEVSLDMLEACCTLAQCDSAQAARRLALAALVEAAQARTGVLYGMDDAGRRLVPLAMTSTWGAPPVFDLEEAQRDAAPIMAVLGADPTLKLAGSAIAAQLRDQVFGDWPGDDVLAIAVRTQAPSLESVFLLLTSAAPRPEWEVFARLSAIIGRRLANSEASRGEAHVLKTKLTHVTQARARLVEQVEDDLAKRLVGDSKPMRDLRNEILRLATSDLSVLVLGETGVGKELIARELHRLSSRRGAPFVALNIAATPASLLEDELFGHVRGAFTGATNTRKGLIAAAQGGTLFLDEIGDMPLELQAKLLRVLQERRYRPIGSDHEVDADFRLLSATHRDLPSQVRAETFRADLFYRLAAARVTAPPLRERGDDAVQLARLFLSRHHLAGTQATLGPDAEKAIRSARFEGNVRELEAAVRRACVFAGERDVILAADLEIDGFNLRSQNWHGASLDALIHLSLPDACERFERLMIANAMGHFGGARESMAKALGIPVRTLSDKLRKHRLNPLREAGSVRNA